MSCAASNPTPPATCPAAIAHLSRDVCDVVARLQAIEPRHDRQRTRDQILVAVGGERQEPRAVLAGRLNDNVAVRAAETERADPCNSRLILVRPGPQFGLHAQAEIVEPDVRVWRHEVQARWDQPVSNGECDLDEPGDSRSRLEVPDVRLHRAQNQRTIGPAAGAQDSAKRPGFDRIAKQRAGAVGLDVLHLIGRDARVRIREAQHVLLRLRVRRCQAVAEPVLFIALPITRQ